MRISAKDWAMYIARLSRLGKTAENMMKEYIAERGSEDITDITEFAFGLVTKYGEGAAALACEMYDALAKAQGAKVPPASPAYTARFWETKVAMKGTTDAEKPAAVSRLVKRAGADTTMKNAIRDGAQFAWIPSGDSCAFCMTLASRGWQYASKKSLKNGHAEHIHANCDCQYAVRFDQNSTVQGYDPDKYREMYDAAEGSTPQEKINSMRREMDALSRIDEKMAKQNGYGLLLNAKPTAHSKDELKKIVNYAESKGCKIYNINAFDGETQVLLDQIDAINDVKNDFGLSGERITISIQDFHDGTLGQTSKSGKAISFNRLALRSRELTNQYLNEDNALSSSDVSGIAYHEMGHVLANRFGQKGIEIAKKTYYNIFGTEPTRATVLEHLEKNISSYCAERKEALIERDVPRDKDFIEIIPEVLAKDKTNPSDFSRMFTRLLKEVYGR